MPISTAPCTWPSAPIGLMIVPESWLAPTCSTRATPVSRSTLTRTAWQLNCGAVHAVTPTSPTQVVPSVEGALGGVPDP